MSLSWTEIALSAATLLYLVAAMGGVFVLGPWLALRREVDLDLSERFWTAFVTGAAYWIALVMALAPLRFHDAPGLLASSLLLLLAYRVTARKLDIRETWDRQFNRTIRRLLDFLELSSLLSAFERRIRKFLNLQYWLRAWGPWDTARCLIWLVFLYAAYLRIHDSLVHYSYGFSEPYVHLVWLKQFNRGNIFIDGVQPRGFEAFLSALGALCGLEPAVLIRFTGGVMGALVPPAIFFLLRQCRLPWSGALVGTALVAVGRPFQWVIERQTASFPQEAALVFAVAALAFGVRYLRFGRNQDRWTFACGCFAAWSIHSFVGEMLVLASAFMVMDYLWRRQKVPRRPSLRLHESVLWPLERSTYRVSGSVNDPSVQSSRPPDGKAVRVGHVLLAGLLSAAAGNFYLIVGWLLRRRVHFGPQNYAAHRLQIGTTGAFHAAPILHTLIEFIHPAQAVVILPLLVLAVLLALFGMIRRNEAFPSPLFMSLWVLSLSGIMVLQLFTKLRAPIPPDAALLFLTVPVCGMAAYLYSLGLEPLLGRALFNARVRAFFATLALGLILLFCYQRPPAPEHSQSEEQVRLYYQLSAQLPPGWWTMVGQNEDYQLTVHRGFAMRADEFVRTYPPTLKTPAFPTPYLFILVQKHSLPVPEAAKNEKIAQAGDNAALQNWLQAYSASHSDLRLYEDTANVTIYVLYHPEVLRQRIQAGMLPE